jgi:hypothetical protein
MIHLVKTERSQLGEMVRLWQKGDYHYQVECGNHKLDIYQPIEEACLYFNDVVRGFPIFRMN